jgi:hypothetical protein
VVGKKRLEGVVYSDFAAAYGFLPHSVSYSDFVALYLCIPRVRDRQAALTADAVSVGRGTKVPPDDWYYEVAETKAEATSWIIQDENSRAIDSMR